MEIAVKPALSDHIKQEIILALHAGGCLLLHESNIQPPVYMYSDFHVT